MDRPRNALIASMALFTWLAPVGDAPVAASEVVVCYLGAQDLRRNAASDGYWILHDGGFLEQFGSARSFGEPAETDAISSAPVAFETTASDGGYWLATKDGGVFTRGDGRFHGSAVGLPLQAPIIDLEPTSDGGGYWLLGADGGVFTFGDAHFAGSANPAGSPVPFVAIERTASERGYWLARADGAVFPFGDAETTLGAASTIRNRQADIVDMAATPDRTGIWLAAADGGVFAFNAPFHGSAATIALNEPVVSLAPTRDGGGYWLLAEDGGVFTFGNGTFFGSAPRPQNDPRCN